MRKSTAGQRQRKTRLTRGRTGRRVRGEGGREEGRKRRRKRRVRGREGGREGEMEGGREEEEGERRGGKEGEREGEEGRRLREEKETAESETGESRMDLEPLILEANAFSRMERTNSTSLPGTHLTLNIPGSLILIIKELIVTK